MNQFALTATLNPQRGEVNLALKNSVPNSASENNSPIFREPHETPCTRVGTLIVATTYLQLIQKRYMFRSFTVLQCSHQHCVQPVASDVEVVGYL